MRSTGLTRRSTLILGTAALAAPLYAPRLARAETAHEVLMLNRDPDNPRAVNVFSPRVLVVQPGDTVTWLNADNGHNSEATDGMIPDGAEGWTGRINEEVTASFEVPGFYGYHCTPHLSLGMVGLIVVEGDGMMDNLAAAQDVRQRGRAAQAWEEIWEEVDELGLTA
ncbi:MAG: pseudoazurin [Pseudomonadota bacterium]